MENLVDAFKRRRNFGAKQSVGVADDAEFHGSFRMTDSRGVFECASLDTRVTAGAPLELLLAIVYSRS
jgi:hypothetical protein